MFKKKKEKITSSQEKFLDSVVENIPDMVFVKDAKELRFVRFNKAGEDLLGFPKKDMIGKNDYDFFPKDQADFFTSKDRAVLAGKEIVDIPKEPINTKYKGQRFLHTKKIPILDEKGNPVYLLGISEDITESEQFKELEKKNKELEEIKGKMVKTLESFNEKNKELELTRTALVNVLEDLDLEKSKILKEKAEDEALLGAIGEGVLAINSKEEIIYGNDVAMDILGWTSKEIIGKKYYDVFSMTDKNNNALTYQERPLSVALLAGKKMSTAVNNPYFYTRRDGTKFPVAVTVTPVILDGKIIGAINVFRDITSELQIDKAKNEFISLASHQLRTPLTSINWEAEMCLDGTYGKLSKKQEESIRQIHESNHRMIDLMTALLNVSRLEAGVPKINPVKTDIKKTIDSMLSELEAKIEKKEIKITKKYEKDLPIMELDKDLIEIIIGNLLANAVDYTLKSGSIEISAGKDKEYVTVKIKDSGIGIPKAHQNNIFTKLFRADNAKKVSTDGTGLGLYIVKLVLDKIGGGIWFESEENKGTTFIVRIPLLGMKKREGLKRLEPMRINQKKW